MASAGMNASQPRLSKSEATSHYYLIPIPSLAIHHTGLSIEKLANPSDMSYCVLMSPARLGASLKINGIVSLHKLPQWFSSAPGFRGKQKQLWRTALENRVFPKKVNCLVVWNMFFFPSYWEWKNIPTDFHSIIFQRGR